MLFFFTILSFLTFPVSIFLYQLDQSFYSFFFRDIFQDTFFAFISIVEKQFTQDDEGFKTETDVTVAEVRAYREGRHGSEKWANMASFSTATDLFQFRVIPGVTVTTDMRILCDGHTFEITSVENVKGRGMYLEVLGTEVKSGG